MLHLRTLLAGSPVAQTLCSREQGNPCLLWHSEKEDFLTTAHSYFPNLALGLGMNESMFPVDKANLPSLGLSQVYNTTWQLVQQLTAGI